MSSKVAGKPIKSNKLLFDKTSIIREIERKGEYKESENIIKKWEGDEEKSNMFYGKIKNENSTFLGILNDLFEREGYCINNYSNDDSYFGYYSQDVRDKHGFYEFKPEIKKKLESKNFILDYGKMMKDIIEELIYGFLNLKKIYLSLILKMLILILILDYLKIIILKEELFYQKIKMIIMFIMEILIMKEIEMEIIVYFILLLQNNVFMELLKKIHLIMDMFVNMIMMEMLKIYVNLNRKKSLMKKI